MHAEHADPVSMREVSRRPSRQRSSQRRSHLAMTGGASNSDPGLEIDGFDIRPG